MYSPPLKEMRFALDLAGLAEVAGLPGTGELTPDLVDAVLEEAGKLAAEVLAPLNQPGDKEGSRLENGIVYTPKGFKEAYRRFVEGGWNSVPFAPEHGGQGLPTLIHVALSEMWNAANMSFALCPLLNFGAVEAINAHGSPEQKATYLPKMISGEWCGTMNLTEPQAGSDLSLIKTRAVRDGQHYRITGQKIFITYGDHDFTDNIIHLVLARIPEAPAGTRGISLFVVPKMLVKPDGSLGERNDLRCVSLEHKLGIKASPDRGDGLRRRARCRRLPRRRGEPRPRLHVHHDEQREARRRPRGGRDRRAGLPASARLCQEPRAEPRYREQRREARHHHPSPRCPPHAALDARAGRGHARARLLCGRPPRSRQAAPGRGRAPGPRAPRRSSHSRVQGLVRRISASRSPRSASRCTGGWAISRRPVRHSITAMRA